MSHVLTLLALPLMAAAVANEADPASSSPAAAVTESRIEIPQGQWLESFEDARAAAVQQNVPMVLHFEATWCGPCRRMASQVLNQPGVLEQLGNQVVGVRIDADRHRSLIDRFKVSTLPTEVVLSADGQEIARYVGAVTLSSYVSRLGKLAQKTAVAASDKSSSTDKDGTDSDAEKTRSCLIVRRDGKMVGLGGFSPVALTENRKWQQGKEDFVVSYQGVDYFLQSAEEVSRFEEAPQQFIPHLHGCDPVELARHQQARTGAIEFGAFYKGEVFFFASLENRNRFQNNPRWYLGSDHQPVNDSEATELLDMIR